MFKKIRDFFDSRKKYAALVDWIKVLSFTESDTIIIHVNKVLNEEEFNNLVMVMKPLFPYNNVIIMDDSMSIDVKKINEE